MHKLNFKELNEVIKWQNSWTFKQAFSVRIVGSIMDQSDCGLLFLYKNINNRTWGTTPDVGAINQMTMDLWVIEGFHG
jgi:hypothetical protein